MIFARPLTNRSRLLALLAGLLAAVVMAATGIPEPPPGIGGWKWISLQCCACVFIWAMLMALFDVLAGAQRTGKHCDGKERSQ